MVLALPQLVVLFWSAAAPFLSFSWNFGLVAAPLACARLFEPNVGYRERLGLLVLTLLPLVEGVRTGKALLYLYVVLVVLTVLWVRARRVALAGAVALAGLVLVMQLFPLATLLPAPIEALVEVERSQQSWGGRAGRVALAQDAISIWSDFPLLGVGPANSYPYMLRYSVIGTPHSQYFNVLLEFGIIGLGLFVLFVVSAIRFGLRAVSMRLPSEARVFLVAWLASFVAWSVCSLTGDYMLHSIRNGGIEMFSAFYIHWVFLGAAVGAVRHHLASPARVMAAKLVPTTWGALRSAHVIPGRIRA
jgi:O-antigen ligase